MPKLLSSFRIWPCVYILYLRTQHHSVNEASHKLYNLLYTASSPLAGLGWRWQTQSLVQPACGAKITPTKVLGICTLYQHNLSYIPVARFGLHTELSHMGTELLSPHSKVTKYIFIIFMNTSIPYTIFYISNPSSMWCCEGEKEEEWVCRLWSILQELHSSIDNHICSKTRVIQLSSFSIHHASL